MPATSFMVDLHSCIYRRSNIADVGANSYRPTSAAMIAQDFRHAWHSVLTARVGEKWLAPEDPYPAGGTRNCLPQSSSKKCPRRASQTFQIHQSADWADSSFPQIGRNVIYRQEILCAKWTFRGNSVTNLSIDFPRRRRHGRSNAAIRQLD